MAGLAFTFSQQADGKSYSNLRFAVNRVAFSSLPMQACRATCPGCHGLNNAEKRMGQRKAPAQGAQSWKGEPLEFPQGCKGITFRESRGLGTPLIVWGVVAKSFRPGGDCCRTSHRKNGPLLLPRGFRSAFRQEIRSPKPPVLERLGIEPKLWSAMVRDFGRAFLNVAGTAKSVSEARSRKTHRKFYRAQV